MRLGLGANHIAHPYTLWMSNIWFMGDSEENLVYEVESMSGGMVTEDTLA